MANTLHSNGTNQKEETKNFYNKTAHQSFKDWFNNPALLPTLSVFIQHLPEKPLVLDLGCGTGGESKRLLELGAKVTGIDFSEKSWFKSPAAPSIERRVPFKKKHEIINE